MWGLERSNPKKYYLKHLLKVCGLSQTRNSSENDKLRLHTKPSVISEYISRATFGPRLIESSRNAYEMVFYAQFNSYNIISYKDKEIRISENHWCLNKTKFSTIDGSLLFENFVIERSESLTIDLRLLKAGLEMGLNSIYGGLIDHFFATTFLVVKNCPMLYGGLKTVRWLGWL